MGSKGGALANVRIIGLLVTALLLIANATAETVTVGKPYLGPYGTTYPFGNLGGVETYQQLYYASNFSGPMLIESITFFTAEPEFFAYSVFPGTYELTLSTTSASLYGLSFYNATGNIGQFFSGYLSQQITGGRVTISGNPFLYNPGVGNLLLTITGPGDPRKSYTAVFQENTDFALTGAAATVNQEVAFTLLEQSQSLNLPRSRNPQR